MKILLITLGLLAVVLVAIYGYIVWTIRKIFKDIKIDDEVYFS
jgi:nitrate reductase NapE component